MADIKLDKIDLKILKYLQENSKITNLDLSKKASYRDGVHAQNRVDAELAFRYLTALRPRPYARFSCFRS